MKIALIGSTGFVGSAILKEALNRGHNVTALLRHPDKLKVQNDRLSIVSCDIMESGKLAAELKGNDIEISAYNAGWANPDLYREFMKGSLSIQSAVQKSGVKRLIVMGGAGSLFIAPGQQLVDAPGMPAQFKPGSLAARDYLNILKEDSHLEWTYVSPAINMNREISGVRKGIYRTGLDNPVFDNNQNSSISVEDLAVAVIDEAENPKHIRQRFTVGY